MTETSHGAAGVGGWRASGSPRHAARRWISMRPSVYLPLARWKNEHSALGASTQLVVDGFTRSAGTFAVIAFQVAQNDHVRVAHHMHAAAPLVAAARRGLPVLVTARAPEPTILSAMTREPGATPAQWLKTYAAFYDRLLPFRSRFEVATFEEVTSDLGAVIRRLNDRFTTSFRTFDHSEENVEAVFALIEERAVGPPWQPHLNRFISGLISADEYRSLTDRFRDGSEGGRGTVPELRVQRPSEVKEAAKARVRDPYRDPRLDRLRAAAEDVYRAFVGSDRASVG